MKHPISDRILDALVFGALAFAVLITLCSAIAVSIAITHVCC